MADAGRPDGRTDHQRHSGHAPAPRLQPGLQTGPVEGNLRLWQRLYAAGNQIVAAEGQDGGFVIILGLSRWFGSPAGHKRHVVLLI